MADKVNVYIKAIHTDESGNEEIIETKSKGEWSKRESVNYIVYEENVKESGYDSSMIKIDGDKISVVKKNKTDKITTKMCFKTGITEETDFNVYGGSLKISFDTKFIRVFETADDLKLAMQYDIIMNGAFASKNTMEIKVEKIKG